MAKHQKAKSSGGGRNGDRTNGKAWGKNHVSTLVHPGHNMTGRTKPSGHSVGGHSIRKIRTSEHDAVVLSPAHALLTPQGITLASVNRIRESRNTQHRSALRQKRANVQRAVKSGK